MVLPDPVNAIPIMSLPDNLQHTKDTQLFKTWQSHDVEILNSTLKSVKKCGNWDLHAVKNTCLHK